MNDPDPGPALDQGAAPGEDGAALGAAGAALGAAGRHADALAALDAAVAASPDSRDAWYNRGVALAMLGRTLDALLSYDRAVAIDPAYAAGWKAHGNALVGLQQYRVATQSYARALQLDPSLPYLEGALAYAKRMLCDWVGLPTLDASLAKGLEEGRRVSHVGGLFGSPLPGRLVRRCAELYVADRCPPPAPRLPRRPREGRRLRVGYVSGDLRNHPIGYQALALACHHDRALVEPIAYSLRTADEDPAQGRLREAFGAFHDLSALSHEEAVALVRSHALDVAVDLQGHTQHGRMALFAGGLAPLQLNYQCPGTSGAAFLDAVVSDAIALPAGAEAECTERVLRVPGSVFLADYAAVAPLDTPSRAEAGLPERALVLASFSESYKITPDLWDVWMRLLQRCPEAVLWLGLRSTSEAVDALRREAKVRGVDPARLMLASYATTRDAHLARLALADACLDTFHYNGHTTTADALWAGVPVVTATGGTISGRLGPSIVAAAGLPELVGRDLAGYESLALRLCTDPAWRDSLRRRAREARRGAALFDAGGAVRAFESVLRSIADG